jgi:hypothetical protein
MAELHEFLVVSFRRAVLRKHYILIKSPMPTYRPDVLAEQTKRRKRIQIVMEAEIPSTLFSDHTTEQLVTMDEFIRHQESKGIKMKGFLLVPLGKQFVSQANSLLEALFPLGTRIRACHRFME